MIGKTHAKKQAVEAHKMNKVELFIKDENRP